MSKTTPSDLMQRPGPILVVLTGPSGVGKDSVIARLKERGHPAFVVVTATTRPMRPGEVDGVDYHFITRERYDAMLAADEFLEHAEVYGHGYGIPRTPVREALARGTDVLLRIDPQGAATVGRLVPGVVRIFLAPPSVADLERRLRSRRTEDPETLARRLAIAGGEMNRAAECDYVVVNADDQLDAAACQIAAIMTAERARIHRRPVTV